ncbi:unnamed protein product [Heterosigma akashiwo]
MLLTGHGAAVYSVKFDPSGQNLASGSFDKTVLLWNVYGECDNYNMLRAHKNAVLEVAWGDQGHKLVSASADKTLCLWDPNAGKLKKKLTGHTGIVNSCVFGKRGGTMVVSGSDDGTVRVWDTRVRNAIDTFESKWPVLAVEVARDDDVVYTGGLDNEVKAWDLRMGAVALRLEAHTDSVCMFCILTTLETSGLRLSPDSTHLLSNSMDNSMNQWDIRPFKEGSRLTKTYRGHIHNFEKTLLKCGWSPDGQMVSRGSGGPGGKVVGRAERDGVLPLPGHAGPPTRLYSTPTSP